MAVQVELGFLVDHSVSSPAEHPQTSSSCLGPENKKYRPTTARMGQQAAASIRNWILSTRCHGRFFGRKNCGMATERTWNVPERPWNCLERLQKGPRKEPEGSWLPLASSPLPPTHTPNGASGSRAHLLPQLYGVTPPQGGGEGGLDLGPQITRCMLSDRHDEASH